VGRVSHAEDEGNVEQASKLKETKRGKVKYGLRCKECANGLMQVIEEPVQRQVHKRSAHHVRVIARCPLCLGEHRVHLGSAH
jgi:uncharacterized protein with PIN domain